MITIVVVVPCRHTNAIHFNIKAGSTGYIGESSIAIVAIELERAAVALVAGPIRSVDEENVLPSVGVVIQKCTAWTECFRKKLSAISAAVVAELNSGSTRHIDHPKSGRRGSNPKNFREGFAKNGKRNKPEQTPHAITRRVDRPPAFAAVDC